MIKGKFLSLVISTRLIVENNYSVSVSFNLKQGLIELRVLSKILVITNYSLKYVTILTWIQVQSTPSLLPV